MTGRLTRLVLPVLALAGVIGWLAAVPAAQANTSTSYSGTTTDGGVWVADIPSDWNGTVLLYSHGFGPPVAADAPDPVTQQALLSRGYALAGSSYNTNGSWWALDSALNTQFQTLSDVEQLLPSAPQHVIAVGTSMGGLISELEDEHANGRIDGSLTTCGIVAGAVQLNNYQLDGEYAMSQLLAPSENINLVNFTNAGEALNTGAEFDAVAQQAQTTAEGRARLALAMSLMNVATWASGQTMPAPFDFAAQEQQQYDVQFAPTGAPPLTTVQDFVEFGRPSIDQADGGNAAWTKGVNFAHLLAVSPYAPEVISLYKAAGLNLGSDLDNLTRHANITANPAALKSLIKTSVPTGRLQVPELDMHTIADQLVPVQQENYFRHTVERAGRLNLLRQAFVQRQLHCNFTPSELVAGVLAIQHRVNTGHWDSVATPAALEASANGLAAADPSLGTPAFIDYHPARLTGDNGTFPFSFSSFGWGFSSRR
jgi:hypothetical protein